ncbi:hypothetical protein AAKU52_000557 [Pedobacter sp. CG_S7]|uniref:hypothetical protein n=1 Tax=Pedobacter sp. CG_S7 TaxID=3143930 RepID=UPI003392881D
MLKNLYKTHQFFKWLVIIAACFLLVFGSVSLYINFRVKPILAKQLKALVSNSTNNLYSIQFSGISVNCLTGDANLNNVKFFPDTNVLRALISSKSAPNNVYYIQLKKLSIHNVHPLRVFRSKKLNIDEIDVLRPKITMVNKQYAYNENKPPRPVQSPYNFISKFLKEVRVATINFREINFKYINHNQSIPIIDSLENLNITLQDWLIDSKSAEDTTRFYLLKELTLQLSDYSYATSDSLYHVKASEINFTGTTGALNIKKLALVPRYSEMEFAKKIGFAKDRFNIQLSNVNFKGIDFPLFVKKLEFYATEMNIRDGNFAVFNNNALPSIQSDKTGHFPHQLLQQLQSKITIKKLNLSNIDISYTEYDRDSKQKGKVTFEKTSGTVANITNNLKATEVNPIMKANFSTLMMGQGRLDTQFDFNLISTNGNFSYSGELHGLNGSTLNSVTKPLGLVHIKNGMVKKLTFHIKANKYKALGDLEFRYNDLAIALLKKEVGKPGLSRQGLLSFLANQLIINPDNPNKRGVFTAAKIAYDRKPSRSFFNFIWKSLFQGIRYSVGVTPQKEAQIKAQVAKFEKMKVDRDKRKVLREKRRQKKK